MYCVVGSIHVSIYIYIYITSVVCGPRTYSKTCPLQVYDAAEIFAGQAVLTNALRASGRVTASLDIEFWKKYVKRRARRGCPMGLTRNPLDLLEPSGFALLGFIHVHMLQVLLEAWWAGLRVLVLLLRLVVTMLLQAKKDFVLMIGFPCSTLVAMSRASTGRHFFRPPRQQDEREGGVC